MLDRFTSAGLKPLENALGAPQLLETITFRAGWYL
jgi:hypothetical protein